VRVSVLQMQSKPKTETSRSEWFSVLTNLSDFWQKMQGDCPLLKLYIYTWSIPGVCLCVAGEGGQRGPAQDRQEYRRANAPGRCPCSKKRLLLYIKNKNIAIMHVNDETYKPVLLMRDAD